MTFSTSPPDALPLRLFLRLLFSVLLVVGTQAQLRRAGRRPFPASKAAWARQLE